MDKAHFVKVVADASRLNGFYMDDYTAGLLFERFLDIEYVELEKIINTLLHEGKKITYKAILDNRHKKIEKKVEEKEIEKVMKCEEDCKQCTRTNVACQKLNEIGFDYIDKLSTGSIDLKQAMAELHEMFPHFGFDKKIGRCVGVMEDANGEHISVYKYD